MINGRRIKLAISLLVISIISSIILGEGILQVYHKLRHGGWLFEKTNAFSLTYTMPVDDRREYTLRPGNHAQNIFINARGFRGKPIPQEAKSPLVCALGDSVPFGAGVSNDETYPFYLQAVFKKKGFNRNVLNAGVPSYNLRQSLDRFHFDVWPYYKPYLVTLEAANDISLLTQYREKWNPNLTWASIRWSKMWTSNIRSALFYYAFNLRWGRQTDEIEKHEAYTARLMVKNVANVLEAELKFFNENNIVVILLPINPFYYHKNQIERNEQLSNWKLYETYYKLWGYIIDEYNEAFKSASLNWHNVFYFDTRALMDQLNRDEVYNDFIHYSPQGNKVMATALYEFMEENQLLSE